MRVRGVGQGARSSGRDAVTEDGPCGRGAGRGARGVLAFMPAGAAAPVEEAGSNGAVVVTLGSSGDGAPGWVMGGGSARVESGSAAAGAERGDGEGRVSVLPYVEAENPTNASSLTCFPRSSGADNTGLDGRLGA